jgi:preprotein translocase subunit SecG
MAAAFGGGSSQSAFGARAGATVLTKATAVLAVVFMVGALALAIVGQRGPGSVVSGAPAPPAPARPAGVPAAPATPAPAPTPAGSAPASSAPTSTPPTPAK